MEKNRGGITHTEMMKPSWLNQIMNYKLWRTSQAALQLYN